METYFTIGQIPPESFVGFIMTKIVPRHLNEIKQYRSLDYLPFREKLIEVFEEPDLATAYLNAFASLSQTRDETISKYMNRARLLVLKAHPDLAHASRERILITSFLLGLYDRQLASSLAVVKIQPAADAERLAAEGEAVRRDQRPDARSTTSFLTKRVASPLTMRTTFTQSRSPSTTKTVTLRLRFLLPELTNAPALPLIRQSAERRPQRPAATAAGSMGTIVPSALEVAAPAARALKRASHSNAFCAKVSTVYATEACCPRVSKSLALLKRATRSQQKLHFNLAPRHPSLLAPRHPTSRTPLSSATEPPCCTTPHLPTSRLLKIRCNSRVNRRPSVGPPCRSSTAPIPR